MFKLSFSSPQMRITISNNQRDDPEIRSKWVANGNSCLPIQSISSEAQKIVNQNGKMALLILVTAFLSYSLLAYCPELELVPSLQDILYNKKFYEADEATKRSIIKDLRDIMVLEWIKLLSSFVIWLFFLVATVLLASEAYCGKELDTKELFSRIRGVSWKRVVITFLYIISISISFALIIAISLWIIAKFSKGLPLIVMVTVVLILVAICYLYIGAVWILSLVVSLLENLYGIKAIRRAEELMKGKRIQGCALMLHFVISCGAIYVVLFIAMREIDMAIKNPMIIVILRIFFTSLLRLFMFVMYTVFYHERKKEQLEGGKSELWSYAPIDSAEDLSAVVSNRELVNPLISV